LQLKGFHSARHDRIDPAQQMPVDAPFEIEQVERWL